MSDVRSVTVRLHADVDGYIAKMKADGRETDKAFARSGANVRDTNRDLQITQLRMTTVDRSAKGLRSSMLTLETRTGSLGKGVRGLNDDLGSLGRRSGRLGSQIDTVSGRVGLLVEALVLIGPAAAPLSAAVVPALTGMAAEAGAAAGAAGVLVLAVHGLGDGLKALNDYQLNPTQANLEKMRAEMDKLGPDGAHFVRFLDSVGSQLTDLQATARAGFLPGVEDGINSLLPLLPRVKGLVRDIAGTMGELSSQAGAELAGPKFTAFFDYLQSDADPLLMAFAHTVGNVVDGLAAMIVAFAPLSTSFSSGLEGMSAAFADWAHGLQDSDSFSAFVDYVRTFGPQVLDLLGSLAQALTGIAEAAAPVGSVVVPILTAVADAIAAIAKSDLGTPILAGFAAVTLLSRATAAYGTVAETSFGAATIGSIRGLGSALITVTSAQERATLTATQLAKGQTARNAAIRGGLATLGKSAALVGGLALASSGAADSIGLSNTASLALMGTMAGPWGTAVGGAAGFALDLAHANDDLNGSFKSLKVAMDDATPTPDGIAALDQQIAQSKTKLDGLRAAVDDYNTKGGDYLWQISHPVDSLKGFKNSIEGLFGNSDVEEYQTQLEAARKKAAGLRTEELRLMGATNGTGAQIQRQTRALQADVNAMRDHRSATLGAFDAETQFRQALKQARAQAAKNNAGIRGSTEAALNNRSALSSLAASWNNQSAAVKNNEHRVRAAKSAFIDTAVAMGVPKRAAEQLAHRLLEIPKSPIVNVGVVGSEAALSAIARIKSQLDQIPRSLRTTYYVNQVNSISRPHLTPGSDGQNGYADGGRTVPGPRLKPVGVVHADEHVIKQSSRRSLESARPGGLDYMNATGQWPGYATGGRVGDSLATRMRLARLAADATTGHSSATGAHVPAGASYAAAAAPGAVIERTVVERLADKVVVQIGAQQFEGYVDDIAGGRARSEIAANDRFNKVKGGR